MGKIFVDSRKSIDVSKIKIEQIFKNYNAMCRYLGLETGLKGTQKQAQQKEIKRYFGMKGGI